MPGGINEWRRDRRHGSLRRMDLPDGLVARPLTPTDARAVYERWKTSQHPYLTPSDPGTPSS